MNLGLRQTVGGRYRIISQLGQGGFGQTFLAQDQHLPGNQQCVVKQLKPQATDPLTLQTARRLFDTEAQVLYRLGVHEQIPRLFAYFEENQEFYLVQELIEGEDLTHELIAGKKLDEKQTISLLKEILEILEFVHQQNVIHRDVNPGNLIRRKQDGKLVLIDFGAVKQVSTQLINQGQTNFTVVIGTPGYLPNEQANGNPRLCSDIYAVGILGISALTGKSSQALTPDPDTGEISWHHQASVSPELSRLLDKMVCYDFRERYQSATAVIQALKDLDKPTKVTLAILSRISPPPLFTQLNISLPSLQTSLISLSLIGFATALAISAVNLVKSANATDLYQRGETLLQLKRYEDALSAYNRAVQLKPEYAEAWNGQGNTLASLKRYDEALEAYDQAIEIQPDYLPAWNGRGKTLALMQRNEEAIDAFDVVIRITSNLVGTWEKQDKEQVAIAWNERGNTQMKLQRYSAAIASFDKTLELQPDHFLAWSKRGWAFHNLRQYKEAVASYDKALDYKPDSSQSWYQLGNAQINLGKYTEAVASYEKAVQFQPDFYQAWFSQGHALIKLNRYEEAVNCFDQVLENQPKNYQAWYSRGWALHNLNRYEEAVSSYEKATQLRPNSGQAWYNRGNALYKLARYQEALTAYNKALQNQPNYYQAWYSHGNTLVSLHQYQQAVESYNQAIRYQPNYKEARKARDKLQKLLAEKQSQVEEEQQEEEQLERRGLLRQLSSKLKGNDTGGEGVRR
ncbi:MAG: tetratricopeptide repeat protein [Coleofasciculaceae cyanobacterium]